MKRPGKELQLGSSAATTAIQRAVKINLQLAKGLGKCARYNAVLFITDL